MYFDAVYGTELGSRHSLPSPEQSSSVQRRRRSDLNVFFIRKVESSGLLAKFLEIFDIDRLPLRRRSINVLLCSAESKDKWDMKCVYQQEMWILDRFYPLRFSFRTGGNGPAKEVILYLRKGGPSIPNISMLNLFPELKVHHAFRHRKDPRRK